MCSLAEPRAGLGAGGSVGAQQTENRAVVVQSTFSRELQGAGMDGQGGGAQAGTDCPRTWNSALLGVKGRWKMVL